MRHDLLNLNFINFSPWVVFSVFLFSSFDTFRINSIEVYSSIKFFINRWPTLFNLLHTFLMTNFVIRFCWNSTTVTGHIYPRNGPNPLGPKQNKQQRTRTYRQLYSPCARTLGMLCSRFVLTISCDYICISLWMKVDLEMKLDHHPFNNAYAENDFIHNITVALSDCL